MKHIKMDYQFGMVYDIFTKACELSLKHQCDNVVFEFNGGMFSVDRSSVWNDITSTRLQTFPRVKEEVSL